jgi:hypothetical protein
MLEHYKNESKATMTIATMTIIASACTPLAASSPAGFRPLLARTTALAATHIGSPPDLTTAVVSWPSFPAVALGIVDPASRPIIVFRRKDPMQRDAAVAPAQAVAQGSPSDDGAAALDPRLREDDGGSSGPTATSAKHPLQPERTGPLRNGNPRGNPNAAPRCGARTRRTGCPCRAPAMRNGRCRLHGGKSTGPRTEEGRARIRAARTRHGRYTAESRAFQRDITGLLRSSRKLLTLARQPGPAAALRHLAPPEFGKHLMQRERNENLFCPSHAAPPTPSPLPSPSPLHWVGERPSWLSREHLLQREPPVQTQAPVAAPRTTPARRPILLSRPTPVATACPRATTRG